MKYEPVLIPWIKNVEPMSVVEKMFSPELMVESNMKRWAKINELLTELEIKVAIERRDGSVQVLDDTSQILKESFKDLKGNSIDH